MQLTHVRALGDAARALGVHSEYVVSQHRAACGAEWDRFVQSLGTTGLKTCDVRDEGSNVVVGAAGVGARGGTMAYSNLQLCAAADEWIALSNSRKVT